jgi:DNA-binding transcriptional regulator YiaG
MRKRVSKPTRLEQIRRARGIPRYVLAMASGVSMGVVCAWENWDVIPSKRKTIERIARVLEVEPQELLEDSEKEVSDA